MRKIYFFIGIGGISMSGLAEWIHSQGDIIFGSDEHSSRETSRLEKLGIQIYYKHDREHITSDIDYVVYSGAIKDDNPELVKARELGIKTLSRGEMLEKVASKFRHIIAIAGAHGKTTTTEMIGEMFFNAGKAPTVHIGGVSNFFDTNFHIDKKKFFITEACEYKNSFLNLKPSLGVVTNIEAEHLDFFKTFDNVKNSFNKFCNNSKKVVRVYKNIAYSKKFRVEAKNIRRYENSYFEYNCFVNDIFRGKIKLRASGKHNVYNSLLAITTALEYKIDFKIIQKSLENFKGVKRRYEIIAEDKNVVIHDYAHHPTEIKKVIECTRLYRPKKLIVAFQPHTYSRTSALMDDFIKSLSLADEVYIFKTYSAREKVIKGGTAFDLYKNLSTKKHYFSSFEKGAEKIKKHLKEGELLLILGAGDIENLTTYFKL